MRYCFLIAAMCLWGLLQAQAQQILDHEEFNTWKTIESKAISPDGRWVAYVQKPNWGDGNLHIYDAVSKRTRVFPRSGESKFTSDSRYILFRIKPPLDSTIAMRKRKVKKEDLPKDTLAIYELGDVKLRKIPGIRNFVVPAKWSGTFAYQIESRPSQAGDTTNTPRSPKGKKNGKDAFPLVIYNFTTEKEELYEDVVSYTLAEEKPMIAWHMLGQKDRFHPGIYVLNCESNLLKPVFRAKGDFKQLKFDKKGSQLGFIANLDTTKTLIKKFGLFYWTESEDSAKVIVPPGSGFLPANWLVSEHATLSFSASGERLFFGIAPAPIVQDTTLLEEEIISVEVWNYRDKVLYTQQEAQLERERKRSYVSVWDLKNNKGIQLSDETLREVEMGNEGNAEFALGIDEGPYRLKSSWEGGPSGKDIYLVNVSSGQRKIIAKEMYGQARFSPGGKYIFWYSYPDSSWVMYSTEQNTTASVGIQDKIKFFDELNDVPDFPGPYGVTGWKMNDEALLVYDRYDIWELDPNGNKAPVNLTQGRNQELVRRYISTDPEARWIDVQSPLLLHVTNEKTKEQSYEWLNYNSRNKTPLNKGAYKLSDQVLKAQKADKWIFTKETFRLFPDLLYSQDLKTGEKISDVNPQQKKYTWGNISLHSWTSLDGLPLQGLLVKPDNFDPNRQYPMMVYFYERNSDNLHNYPFIAPGRSSINYAFYASRGYIVFVPDIPYKIGYPGESAYNAVIPGVTSLIEKGFVDRARIGVQGHSWGGYQIAYLLTRTNIFRCAEAGAPVVNMVSAYGGIRWGTGLSRMFQYEKTQSRIGGTLWEYPMRFLENSPIFTLDKVTTPVLILHNDADDAVPWYQGIEYFVAMRRLGKPAWLLNYNGEPHGVQKFEYRRDFQHRMQQFFDHYLKDAPMPTWMQRGVPALEKGILQGLEPVQSDE